jgi:phage-related tail fiber protein
MAEFKQLIITDKGHALMSKIIAGTGNVEFTKIAVSDATYQDSGLQSLTAISSIKQESLVSKVTRTNDVAVKVESSVSNLELTTGYFLRTIGLYATDPDEGEILYAVTTASVEGYMPPYNGLTVSGAYFKLVTTVSNSENVTLEVDPAAIATIGDIQDLQEQIDNPLLAKADDATNNKRYVYGLEIQDGKPYFIFEEEV